MSGSRDFVIFVDNYSRFTWIYLIWNRPELPSIYSKFANMISTQFSCTIKIIGTDNAMEYKQSSLTQFLSQNGTIVQRSFPRTSPQNRHAEENTNTFWIQLEPFWSPLLALKVSGGKLLLLLFTQSIVFPLLSLVMFLHLTVYIIVL